jgi:hypothetical protein
MSNLTFVNDALRLIGVLPDGQDASANDGALVLRVATELVDEWGDDGIVVQWSPNPQLSDECSLVGTELTALKYAVAARISPHYGREISPTLGMLGASAYSKLLRVQVTNQMEASDPILPPSDASRSQYNITTDE